MNTTTEIHSTFNNQHVTKLIRLQQDGKDAISGPTQWLNPPLLNVSTDSEEDVSSLVRQMCPRTDDTANRGRWHWLIGSPGNGKSAKLGAIARRLKENGYEIRTDEGLHLGSHDTNPLPYLLKVHEPNKPYSFAYLVQDASVVRKPYSEDCDPAKDLTDVLREATARGTSLLLCTNWGVLERLFDICVKDDSLRNEPWFRAVKGAIEHKVSSVSIPAGGGSDGEKPVFDALQVSYELMDRRSLLVDSHIFEELILKAIRNDDWEICSSCPSVSLCPFKANRDDLTSPDLRKNVLDILRRAEVFSGQIVVFREAIALISLLLAGCPIDHDSNLPCEWVHDQRKNNRLFNLLARRIPAILFSGKRLHGLDARDPHRLGFNGEKHEQLIALKTIQELDNQDLDIRQTLVPISECEGVSADVGIERLLGSNGVIPTLDPLTDPRHAETLDDLFADLLSAEAIQDSSDRDPVRGIRDIEKRCIEIWERIYDVIAAEADPVIGQDLYFWIRRWQTNHLAWIAAVTHGVTAYQSELESYLRFLASTANRDEHLATLIELNGVLKNLLAPPTEGNEQTLRVELSNSLWLSGQWAQTELRPRLIHDSTKGNNALFVNMSQTHRFLVAAETYIWLKRQHDLNLSALSSNPDILDALRRTQAQAAAASQYSIQNEDIELLITDEDDSEFRVIRAEGHLLKSENH